MTPPHAFVAAVARSVCRQAKLSQTCPLQCVSANRHLLPASYMQAVTCATPASAQVRICTRIGVELKSTDFRSREYYTNIRKALTAGFFMQVHLHSTGQHALHAC